MQEASASVSDEMHGALPTCYWSSLVKSAMDCARDERIIGESNRSPAHCHAKSEMGTVSDDVAGFTKCVAECNFNCGYVRVYRGGVGVRPDFR